MTEYGKYIIQKPTSLLTYDRVKADKEARKKLLEQVEQRRAENYRRWHKKMQLQPDSDLI